MQDGLQVAEVFLHRPAKSLMAHASSPPDLLDSGIKEIRSFGALRKLEKLPQKWKSLKRR